MSREGIPTLPYSVEEIYGIRDSGKYGTLKRTYNEFYHLYPMTDYREPVKPEKVITEDSNSGFQFFREICIISLNLRNGALYFYNRKVYQKHSFLYNFIKIFVGLMM